MKKRKILLAIGIMFSLCIHTLVLAEELRTNDGSNDFILEIDNNGLGYTDDNPNSADQTGNYLLTGNLESFDTGYGNTATGYRMKTGLQATFEANVPEVVVASTDNGILLYNKLLTQIDPNDNPTTADGTLFALQIDTDSNFTNPKYINPSNFQPDDVTNSDLSVYYKPCAQSTTPGPDDTRWNCGTVVGLKRYINGLVPNTTYYVRGVAKNGDFTNSEFGPAATATTNNMILSFDLSSNTTSFGTLSIGSVNTASPNTILTSTTNAENGYNVYVNGQGSGVGSPSGLYSAYASHLIASVNGALTAGTEGYGLQGSVTTGTPTVDSQWAVSGNNVGQLLRTTLLYYSNSSPSLPAGDQVTTIYKAAISGSTTSSSDYQDIVTYTMNASF